MQSGPRLFFFALGLLKFSFAWAIENSTPNTQAPPPELSLASCFGRPIQEVDLSMQLGPTKNQSGGLCYSYAAVAALEAAAYRTDGVVRNISAEAAAAYAERKGFLTAKDRFKELKRGEYYLSGGEESDVLEALIRLDYFSRPEAFEKYWSLLNQSHSALLSTKLPHEVTKGEKVGILTRIENFITAKIVGTPDAIKKKWAKDELSYVLRLYRKNEKPKVESLYKTFKKQHLFKNFSLSKNYKAQKASQLDSADQVNSNNYRITNCGSDNPEVKQNIENIMQYLCSGIPLTSGVVMNGTKVTKTGSYESTKTWESDEHANHAMLIQGVKVIDGMPHFIFRNSWVDGYKDPGSKSLAYIPFSEACKIYDVNALLTPSDPPIGKPNYNCEGPAPGQSKPIICNKIRYTDELGLPKQNPPKHNVPTESTSG